MNYFSLTSEEMLYSKKLEDQRRKTIYVGMLLFFSLKKILSFSTPDILSQKRIWSRRTGKS
jgi:hypothetical protein